MRTNTLIFLLAAVLKCFLFGQVHSYNILGVFPFIGKSHFYVYGVYLKELARKGHNVTVISYFPQKEPVNNYHDINLGKDNKYFDLNLPIVESKLLILLSFTILQPLAGLYSCRLMLDDEEIQNLLQSDQKFDLVVVEQFNSDCALSIAYKLGAPVIGITSSMLLPWHYTRYGVTYNPSYDLYDLMKGGTKPNFFERVVRTISFQYINFIQRYVCMAAEDKMIAEYFDDVPPLEELARQIRFLLIYQNFIVSGSQVLPSNIIEVGGYHVVKPKKLSDELNTFIDESKNGVIYVSFGTILNPASMKREMFEAIFDVLKELPQRIIWKWNKKIPNKPDDMYVSKWMPQNDILAHPNVIAFFSHCGQLGTTEAVHHGVPILGMPILGDQFSNAAAIEERRLGVQISLNELSKKLLLHKFQIILDSKFRENVKQLSKMWRDRPVSALDTAVHWTEFAARYHNFTFRPASADVPLYQYLGLDVMLVFIALFISCIFVIKYTLAILNKQFRNKIKLKKA